MLLLTQLLYNCLTAAEMMNDLHAVRTVHVPEACSLALNCAHSEVVKSAKTIK